MSADGDASADEEQVDPDGALDGLFVDQQDDAGDEDTDANTGEPVNDGSVDVEPDEADVTDLSMVANEDVPEDNTTSGEREDDDSDSEGNDDDDDDETVNDDSADADEDTDEDEGWVGDTPEWQQEAAEELDELIESVDADGTDNPSAHAAHAWSLVEKLTEVQLGIRIDDIVEFLESIADEDVTQDDVKSRRGSAAATRDTLEDKVTLVETERTPDPDAIWETAGEVCDEYFEEQVGRVVDALNTLEDTFVGEERVRTHRRLAEQADHDPIFVAGNKTWMTTRVDNGEMQKKELLDFELDVERFVYLEGEGEIADITVTPAQSPAKRYSKEIDPTALNQVRDFKSEVMDRVFDTTIAAKNEATAVQEVKKWIGRQDVPRLIGQQEMGLSESVDEFVLPTGTIGADGWADEPSTVYYSNGWAVEDRVTLNPGDTPDYDAATVAEMVELLTQTRVPERGLPVFAWHYATPFKRMIMDAEGQHNPLGIAAESGAGKSAILTLLGGMMGTDGGASNLKDSPWAFKTKWLASRGVPIWFDEYKGDLSDYEQDRLVRFLRSSTSGEVVESGNQDRSTESFTMKSPVVISGEAEVNGVAEERRAIQTSLLGHATEDDEYVKPFKKLAGEDFVENLTSEDADVTATDADYPLDEHALAYYSRVAAMDEDEFRSKWRDAKQYVVERLNNWGHAGELSDMERQQLQTVAFGYTMMREFVDDLGGDVESIPGWDALDDALRHVAAVGDDARESDVERYMRQVALAALDDHLEAGTHYKVVKEGQTGEQLRINLNRAHDKVRRYVNEHDADTAVLNTADDYKTRIKEMYERGDEYVVNWSQNTPPVGRCIGINLREADDEITGFDRSIFVDDEADEDGDDENDAVGPVTPSELSEEHVGERLNVERVSYIGWHELGDDSGAHAVGDLYEYSDDVDVEVPVIAFEKPSGMPDPPARIRLHNAKIGTYEGDVQVQVDEDTSVVNVVTPDDDQETLDEDDDDGNCGGETVNGDDNDSDGEHTTPRASDAGEAAQRGVRADGSGDESDTQAIDNAAMQAAESADTVAAVAGRVSGMVETDDLDQIRHRVERLAERGDIILDELTIADDEDEGSEGTSNHIPVAEALRRVGGRNGLSLDDAVVVLQHDTAVPPGREREALEVAEAVDVSGERVVVSA